MAGISWVRSSRSGGSKPRVGVGVWRKSARSMANGACVEIAVIRR